MSKRLSEVTVSKASALAVILAIAVMPWFQGGRDPVGWMVLLGVVLVGSFILWRSPLKLTLSWLSVAWLALLGWTGLSLIWTVNRYQTATTLMLYLFVGIIFALAQALRTDKTATAVWRQSYVIIATIASLVGVILFVLYSYDRATSTFYLPNPFAAFLLPAIIIGLWRFAEQQQLIDGLLAMFNLGVFILIDSRGGTLVLAVIIFAGLMLSQKLIKHWRRLALVLVGALAVALLGNLVRSQVTHHFSFQGERYRQLTSDQSNSTSDRVYYVKSALAIWADRPVLGSGAGTYATMHPHYQYRVVSAGNNAHNFYIQTLSELGIVGVGLLVWIIIVLITGMVKELVRDPSKLPLALGLLALLLHAAIDVDANYPVLWALAATLAGLCYLPSEVRKISPKLLSSSVFTASLILALPTIWLFQGLVGAQNGQISQENGDYIKAANYYLAGTKRLPYDPDWLEGAGINYYLQANINHQDKVNNYRQALSLARQAQRLDPQDAQHDQLLGRIYLAQDQKDLAEAAFKRAIAKDPYNQPDYYNDLASLYLRENKLSAARSSANVVITLYPDAVVANRNNDPNIVSSVGTSYAISAQALAKLGQLDEARAQLHHALKIDPGNIYAAFELNQIGK